jgi:signal peptidase II
VRRGARGLIVGSIRARHLWIVALVVFLDQVVKALIRARLELHDSITVIPGFFDLTRVHNTGAAFGLFDAAEFPFKTVLISLLATGALLGLAAYAASLDAGQPLTRYGLALVIGGAAGNLIDRIKVGYVLDFVVLYWREWDFWAFNVADAAINIGVALMILELLGIGRHRVPRAV